jgi:hypothetical protein
MVVSITHGDRSMHAIVRRGALFALAAFALAVPASARAQNVLAVTGESTPAVVQPAGPTVAAASVAVQALPASSADASAEAAAMQSRAGLGQSRALMFVGLATLIAGAVIGGDAGTVIMIAGAGIGLWGLYQYLQ